MNSPAKVITGFRRPNLSFEVRQCSGRKEKFKNLKTLIAEAHETKGSTVIYGATRKHVEMIAGELGAKTAAYYHAGLSDEERAEVQEDFLAGRTKGLVATNA